jgi:hypothetical protein
LESLVKITGALQVAAKAITMASVAAIVPALPVAARSHVSQARDVADLKGLQQPNFGDVDCGPRSLRSVVLAEALTGDHRAMSLRIVCQLTSSLREEQSNSAAPSSETYSA